MNDLIPDRIRKIIEHYGLSVSSFADKIGVQRSSVSHLLNGRNRPSLDFVMKVVQSYPEVNLYWLLNGKGEFPSEEIINPSSTPSTSSIENLKAPTRIPSSENDLKEPVKIVIFYSDGSFESFHSKNK